MTYRRGIAGTRVAMGVVVTLSALSTADAQAPRQPGPPCRPAAGAKDLRAVLFNWTWAMGMLRAASPGLL